MTSKFFVRTRVRDLQAEKDPNAFGERYKAFAIYGGPDESLAKNLAEMLIRGELVEYEHLPDKKAIAIHTVSYRNGYFGGSASTKCLSTEDPTRQIIEGGVWGPTGADALDVYSKLELAHLRSLKDTDPVKDEVA